MATFKLNYQEKFSYIDIVNSLNSECNDNYELRINVPGSPVHLEITSFGPAGFNTGIVSITVSSTSNYIINLGGYISKDNLLNTINSHIVVKVKADVSDTETLDSRTFSRTHTDESC